MKNKTLLLSPLLVIFILSFTGCIHYSMSGAATAATSIQVDEFFNNTDLGPANLGQTFTNRLKDYYQQNSSLRIVSENGELQIEGTMTEYRINPVAPVSGSGSQVGDPAALTRLTISVKVNYVDTLKPENSFKDRTFGFYDDFPNTEDFNTVQERLEKKIFDQILIDIFNATLANW